MSKYRYKEPGGNNRIVTPIITQGANITYTPMCYYNDVCKVPWESDIITFRSRQAVNDAINRSTNGYKAYGWASDGLNQNYWNDHIRIVADFGNDNYYSTTGDKSLNSSIASNWANKFYNCTLYDEQLNTEPGGVFFNLKTLSGITTNIKKMTYQVSTILSIDKDLFKPQENVTTKYRWGNLPKVAANSAWFNSIGMGDCTLLYGMDITGTLYPPNYAFYFGFKGGRAVTDGQPGTMSAGKYYKNSTHMYCVSAFNNGSNALTAATGTTSVATAQGGYAKYIVDDRAGATRDYLYVNYYRPLSADGQSDMSAISSPVIGLIHDADYTSGALWKNVTGKISGYIGTTLVERNVSTNQMYASYGMYDANFDEFYSNRLSSSIDGSRINVSTHVYMHDLMFGINCVD